MLLQNLYGTKVQYIPVDKTGTVRLSELRKIIQDGSLVSVMYANNEIGTIEPIKEIANIAHEHDCIFHTDAVQAVGHIPINVQEMGIDLLSASAHKFNGPKGVGFLYKRNNIILSPLIYGGSQESGLRAGTENVAEIVAMATALEENILQIVNNTQHIKQLENQLISMLTESDIKFQRNGAPNHIPGNISLSFPEADGEALLHRLDFSGICVSTGSACDSKKLRYLMCSRQLNLKSDLLREPFVFLLVKIIQKMMFHR